MSGPLRGLGPLLRDRARVTLPWLAGLGLIGGVLVGWVQNLAEVDARDVMAVIGIVWGMCAVIGPPVASAWVSWGMNQGSSRREELLASPLGRLVIPTHVLLLGLLGSAGSAACFTAGLGLVEGAGRLQDALRVSLEHDLTPVMLCVIAGLFAWTTYLCTVASSLTLGVLGWPIVMVVLVMATSSMGHAGAEPAWLAWWIPCLSVGYLVTPFLLYAGPRHVWAVSRVPNSRELAVPAAFMGVAAGLTVLGLLGLGWTFLTVGGLTVALVYQLVRKAPAGSRGPGVTALLISQAALLLAAAPPLVVGAVVDARRVNALVAGGPDCLLLNPSVAPGGARVALNVSLAHGTGGLHGLSRVVVLDPSGGMPPVHLGERFARLAGWSRDGRYLAVHELALGRLASGEVSGTGWPIVERMIAGCCQTLVLDTHTGQVQTLSLRAVAPGWNDPSELVEVRPSLGGGQWLLRDDRGRALSLPRRARIVVGVMRYQPEGALILLEAYGLQPSRLLLWGQDGTTREVADLAPTAEGISWSQSEPEPGQHVLQIRRAGARVLEVPNGHLVDLGAERALIQVGEALYRYRLPAAGEAPGQAGEPELVPLTGPMRRVISSETGALVQVDDRWIEVSADAGLGHSFPAPEGWVAKAALAGSRYLLEADGAHFADGGAVLEPDGTVHPLVN